MKRPLTTWVSFWATAFIMPGFSIGEVQAGKPSQESELSALNDAWIDAEVHHDRGALERILDERCLITLSSGNTVTRSQFIDRILTMEIKPFVVLNEAVNVHGDAALVISTTTDRTKKFTWVAVKKQGQWRVISETLSKISPPD
jgi:hypothetical protein